MTATWKARATRPRESDGGAGALRADVH